MSEKPWKIVTTGRNGKHYVFVPWYQEKDRA
jgi:hypothetical protein